MTCHGVALGMFDSKCQPRMCTAAQVENCRKHTTQQKGQSPVLVIWRNHSSLRPTSPIVSFSCVSVNMSHCWQPGCQIRISDNSKARLWQPTKLPSRVHFVSVEEEIDFLCFVGSWNGKMKLIVYMITSDTRKPINLRIEILYLITQRMNFASFIIHILVSSIRIFSLIQFLAETQQFPPIFLSGYGHRVVCASRASPDAVMTPSISNAKFQTIVVYHHFPLMPSCW